MAKEAFGLASYPVCAWRGVKGGFFDAQRPGVEPEGLESEAEVTRHRAYHLKRVREVLQECDVFIFTFGLTEVWEEKSRGRVYPTAPGTIAGDYDERLHAFRNLTYADIYSDFLEFREIMRSCPDRPEPRFLLTVSPVPLAATATDRHVMVATVHSKSVLRAVAGALDAVFEDISYFPSFELVTNPWVPVCNFEDDLRSVKKSTVEMIMGEFLRVYGGAVVPLEEEKTVFAHEPLPLGQEIVADSDDVICEEALLEAFAPREAVKQGHD